MFACQNTYCPRDANVVIVFRPADWNETVSLWRCWHHAESAVLNYYPSWELVRTTTL